MTSLTRNEPLTHNTDRPAVADEADPAPGTNAVDESVGDADRMLRMIVGSTYLDPQDIRRKLDDSASRDAAEPGQDLNFSLVILAAALVFLLFACDLIFLKG